MNLLHDPTREGGPHVGPKRVERHLQRRRRPVRPDHVPHKVGLHIHSQKRNAIALRVLREVVRPIDRPLRTWLHFSFELLPPRVRQTPCRLLHAGAQEVGRVHPRATSWNPLHPLDAPARLGHPPHHVLIKDIQAPMNLPCPANRGVARGTATWLNSRPRYRRHARRRRLIRRDPPTVARRDPRD